MTARSRRQVRLNSGLGPASVKSEEPVPQTPVSFNSAAVRRGRNALFAIAIIYAFLAGFRTVHDYDLGWQLATARWMVQHHSIPSTDVITYTVRGKPWIYPVLSGLMLYGLYLRWGYPALTWFLAIASAGVMVLVTRQNRLPITALAVVAVPLIVNRLTPRADAFSMVLFAAVLSVLWQYHRTGKERLWLLPVLMLIWVNLHWGFVFGLGLCGAYVILEAGEFCFAGQRAAALERLRKAWPWLLASGLVTLVNPWGPRLYLDVVAWSRNLASPQSATVQEFLPLRISWTNLIGGLVGGQNSEIFWMLCVAGIAAIVAAVKKKPAESALLIGSAFSAVERLRFSAMFACIVVVVGGSVLSDALAALFSPNRRRWILAHSGAATVLILSLSAITAAYAAVRSYDLVSNRYYLGATSPMLFGTGLSWWYPERALAFVEREHLPGNLFNLYELGGFLAWRLPQYGDFVDSRGWPFFVEQLRTSTELARELPNSVAWQSEANTWGINTLIFSLARVDGLQFFPHLMEFCQSQIWRPVYMDEVSAVFLRRSPETETLVDHLQIDCNSAGFTPPVHDSSSWKKRGDLFNYWSNAASVLASLDRRQEALDAMNVAQEIFPDSAHLHMDRGQLVMLLGRNYEAEQEFRRSIELKSSAEAWEMLGDLLWSEQRYYEALAAIQKATEISFAPDRLYVKYGLLASRRQRPREALAAFDQAARFATRRDSSTTSGAEFYAALAEGRGHAWFLLGELQRAIEFQEQAVHFTPKDARRWKDLAYLYQAAGRTSDAQRALQQIK